MNKKPNCYQCKYFRVTWDRNFPYSCSILKFKGKMLPSTVVKQASGMECAAFEQKSTIPSAPTTPAATPSGPPVPGTILKLPSKPVKKT